MNAFISLVRQHQTKESKNDSSKNDPSVTGTAAAPSPLSVLMVNHRPEVMMQHVRALPTAELEPLIRLAVTQRRIEALLFLVECLGHGPEPAACQLSPELASAVLKVPIDTILI